MHLVRRGLPLGHQPHRLFILLNGRLLPHFRTNFVFRRFTASLVVFFFPSRSYLMESLPRLNWDTSFSPRALRSTYGDIKPARNNEKRGEFKVLISLSRSSSLKKYTRRVFRPNKIFYASLTLFLITFWPSWEPVCVSPKHTRKLLSFREGRWVRKWGNEGMIELMRKFRVLRKKKRQPWESSVLTLRIPRIPWKLEKFNWKSLVRSFSYLA